MLIVGFLFLVIKLVKKGKDSFWTGEVIDKKHIQRRDSESKRMNDFYTIIFKTDNGKQVKVGVAKEEYDDWKVGDKGEKKKGQFKPKKTLNV